MPRHRTTAVQAACWQYRAVQAECSQMKRLFAVRNRHTRIQYKFAVQKDSRSNHSHIDVPPVFSGREGNNDGAHTPQRAVVSAVPQEIIRNKVPRRV